MGKRTIRLFDSEIVYSIGAIEESFRFLDQYRRDFAGKGVNNITEVAMSGRYNTIETMVEALNGEYPRVVEDFAALTKKLQDSHDEVPWETPVPW